MTDSVLTRLREALKHIDLIRISHPREEFDEGSLWGTLNPWKGRLNSIESFLQKNELIEAQPSLFHRLYHKGHEDLRVIQPPVEYGCYEKGYFISEHVIAEEGKNKMTVPGFAVVDREQALRIYISGSITVHEAELALDAQAKIAKAIMPFLQSCINYAEKNKLNRIVVVGYSRGATAIINAGTGLVGLCRAKNIGIDFFPIAALEPDKEIHTEIMPIRLAMDIAGPGKNILNDTGQPPIPSITISHQDGNENYTDDPKSYVANVFDYVRSHSIKNYTQNLTELTTNPLYQSVLGQVEQQPCRIHYVNKNGSYDKNFGAVDLYADPNSLNIVMPFEGILYMQPAERASQIFYYDHIKAEERVVFDKKDDTFVIVKGRECDFEIERLYYSKEIMLYSTKENIKGGGYVNPKYIVFEDGYLRCDISPPTFECFPRNMTDRLSYCSKKLAPSLRMREPSVREAILVKH